MLAVQTTLDEGIPLSDVTFCVVDLETTGGSPHQSAITEVGAVKYRGGEKLGTFSTLVNPVVARKAAKEIAKAKKRGLLIPEPNDPDA